MGIADKKFKRPPRAVKLGLAGMLACAALLFTPLLDEMLGWLGWGLLLRHGEDVVAAGLAAFALLALHGLLRWSSD